MHSSCHDALLGFLTLPNLKCTHMDFLGQTQDLPGRNYKVALGVFAQLERTPLNK